MTLDERLHQEREHVLQIIGELLDGTGLADQEHVLHVASYERYENADEDVPGGRWTPTSL